VESPNALQVLQQHQAAFLSIVAFSLLPRIGFTRLLTLAAMNVVVMLWSHAFDR
jgi:hypothetical protein